MKTSLRSWSSVSVVLVLLLLLVAIPLVAAACGSSGGAAQAATPPGAASPGSAAAGTGFSPEAIYARSASGVVLITSTFKGAGLGGFGGQALGSGFVVSKDGTIITNAHVVSENGVNASSVTVSFRQGQDQTSQEVKATLVGVDQTTDIAVLKVDPGTRTLTPLPLGDSSKVVIGEWVVAIGNPLGYSFSLTQGIVSGVARNLQAPNNAVIPNGIQTDAAINQGNSGGPLLDASGNVIGVNEQIASPSGSFSGLGFAIPIDTAKSVMQQLLQSGSVKHAYLGISGQTIDQTVARLLKLPVTQGVLVAHVQNGTAAAKAGIKGGTATTDIQGAPFVTGGDIITKLDGQPLTGMQQLAAAIAEKQPGDQVTLTVLRNGATSDVVVTLGNRP